MKAFVIITYTNSSWSQLFRCYHSLRKFDSETIVIIVNNFNEDIHHSLQNETNIRYIKNINNGYELGAIKIALYDNEDISEFFIVHDSCEFINNIPQFENDTILWKTSIVNIAPALDIIKDWCDKYFPDIVYNKITNVICQGLKGCFKRKLLLKIFDYGLKNIEIKYKI